MTSITDQINEGAVASDALPSLPSTAQALTEYYKGLFDGKQDFLGIRTGFDRLDRATFGLSGLVVLSGTPGRGKTSFALHSAVESAVRYGTPVLFYSMEMPKRALFTKIISRIASVRFVDILLYGQPFLDESYQQGDQKRVSKVEELASKEADLHRAKALLQSIAELFVIKDASDENLTTEAMLSEAKLLKAKHKGKAPLIVVDQLQSFPADPDAVGDPKLRIDDLMTDFRTIVDTINGTMIVISQKNRSGYNSKELSALMGSAMIEYTADSVMMLEDAVDENGNSLNKAKEDTKPEDFPDDEFFDIDLKIAKQRYGVKCKLNFRFYPVFGRFEEDNGF